MLRIRPEQIDAFVLARTEDYLAELCGKLRVEMPDLCERVELEEVVRQGFKKARHYGIESEATVERFIRIQLALGVDFDCDPSFPWAARILQQNYPGGEVVKMGLLSNAVRGHLESIAEVEVSR